jgi:hypothetical protein
MRNFIEEPGQPASQRKRGRKRQLLPELLELLGLQDDKLENYSSPKELLWAFIHNALLEGLDENVIVEVCLDQTYATGAIFQHVANNGGEAYVKKQIEHTINRTDLPKGEKQIIRLQSGRLDEDQRKTQKALQIAKCPVYRRGGGLVQPLWSWEDAGEDNPREILSCRLMKYNEEQLADMVAHHAVQFQKFNERRGKWVNVDPPEKLIKHILKAGQWGFPYVVGIVNAPTMRPDGSLLTKPGYDPATKALV